MSLSKLEMETIIVFNAKENEAIVHTRDKSIMNKLGKLVEEFPEVYKLTNVTDIEKSYTIPKKYVTYRKPKKVSEEERERLKMIGKKAQSKDVPTPTEETAEEF